MVMCNIFLSYSRKDFDIVRRIKLEIEQATKAKCWMDLEGISYKSPDFIKIIAPAIEQAPIFVFILTPNSQESRYARNELLLAEARKKHIFLLEPNECDMTSEFILGYGHYNRNLYYVDYQRRKLYKEISDLLSTMVVEDNEAKPLHNNIDTVKYFMSSYRKWSEDCQIRDAIFAEEAAVKAKEEAHRMAEEKAKNIEEERQRMMEKWRRKHGPH